MRDSTMTNTMMHTMMKDGKMMGNIMKMMHQNGVMGKECMSSCIQKVDEKKCLWNTWITIVQKTKCA